ncbi:signal peptidase II [Rubricoccus marinus]|uniref:Lipoprotein signal peptidase n=1 Tax=Rubricoccus marinus TaxID=716817 RepID=A0A259TZ00_9BACT|nr:signal peptidase II [Rubricoccus marinus]OZC02837.1 hypothetical protein BSZ36_07530 [Rubricoccus marinus]
MRALWYTLAIVLVDQVTKVIVKSTMRLGESISVVGDVFKWTFTENPGMAFGMELWDGEPIGKLLLSIFSVVATVAIFFYLRHVRDAPAGYRVSLALILGGALGNVIDRVFYAEIWGYGHIFFGKVVDFVHLDVWSGYPPDWLPIWGGKYVALFPIGNIADLAIIAGVVGVLVTQKAFQEYVHDRNRPATPEAVTVVDEPVVAEPHTDPAPPPVV